MSHIAGRPKERLRGIADYHWLEDPVRTARSVTNSRPSPDSARRAFSPPDAGDNLPPCWLGRCRR